MNLLKVGAQRCNEPQQWLGKLKCHRIKNQKSKIS